MNMMDSSVIRFFFTIICAFEEQIVKFGNGDTRSRFDGEITAVLGLKIGNRGQAGGRKMPKGK